SSLEGTVEIHAFDGGYCGFCFIEGGLVNACALFEGPIRKAGTEDSELPSSLPAYLGGYSDSLTERLRGLDAIEGTEQAVAEIPFALKETSQGRTLFVGD